MAKEKVTAIEIRGVLCVALDALKDLAEHHAFAGDAPEFNRGGVGYEAGTQIERLMDRLDGNKLRKRRTKSKPYLLTLASEAYGEETFSYDSFEEAKDGLLQLIDAAKALHDGVVRLYSIQPE
jgi:hypothetical protein